MTNNQDAWSRLKEHPLFIVVSCCATTAAAVAAIYQTVIVPYDLKVLEVQVSELTKQIGSMPKALSEKDATIDALTKDSAALRQRAYELTKDNVFSEDDPYPKSFRHIRIGDPISKAEQLYGDNLKKRLC